MNASPVILQAIDRLNVNSDFASVVSWLEVERAERIEQLLTAVNPVFVHQSQGYVSALSDFLRSVKTAQEVLSALG